MSPNTKPSLTGRGFIEGHALQLLGPGGTGWGTSDNPEHQRRGNNRNLLTVFQSELTSHSVFLQKGPEVICQDAEYFLAQLTIVSGMAKGVSDRYTMGLVVYVFRPWPALQCGHCSLQAWGVDLGLANSENMPLEMQTCLSKRAGWIRKQRRKVGSISSGSGVERHELSESISVQSMHHR